MGFYAGLSSGYEEDLPSCHDGQGQAHDKCEDEEKEDEHARRVGVGPVVVPAHRSADDAKTGERDDGATEGEPGHEEDKVPLVPQTDALVQPRAVVILLRAERQRTPHPPDASEKGEAEKRRRRAQSAAEAIREARRTKETKESVNHAKELVQVVPTRTPSSEDSRI